MSQSMSSRERLLAAINHEEADRVPICFRDVAPLEHMWSSPFERVMALNDLGVDDKLFIHPPLSHDPDVTFGLKGSLYAAYGTSVWPFDPVVTVHDYIETSPGESYPVVCKDIETPKGTLGMKARQTDDWRAKSLPLVSDYIWSRGLEFPVKGFEDLEKLQYLLYDPKKLDLASYRESVHIVKNFAGKHDILIEGDVNATSNIVLSLRGPTNLMCDIAEGNGLAEQLIDMVGGWNLKRLELMLDMDVDTIYHTACYETSAFWSPDMYRRVFRPVLEKKLAMIHEAGAKLHYYMDIGVMPLIDDFKDMGIDILSTLDPAPYGDTDIKEVVTKLGNSVCLWGGVNSPHIIERGSADDVRKAVRDIITLAAPGGGFVLSTADSIWSEDARENVMTFIEAGLEYGRYPLTS